MIVRMRFYLLLAVLVGILSSVAIKNANAAEHATSFTTSPVTLGINILPGTTETKDLEIMNNTSQPVPIEMQVKSFGAQGSSGQAIITDFSTNNPAENYVKFSPSSFTAQPKVWSHVKATISLPRSAELGLYYAIVFQPLYSNAAAPHSNIVEGSNAILVLINTGSANESKNATIANFSATKKLYEYLPATLNVNIKNSGNIFLAPTGDIFISRSSNGTNTLDTLPVNEGGGNVLPGSNRIFTSSWNDGFPAFETQYKNGKLVTDSSGNPVLQLKWNYAKVNKLRFGKYYATLALQYNNGKQEVLLNSTVSFWVVPWKILIVVAVFILLLLYGVFMLVRGIIRRTKKSRR